MDSHSTTGKASVRIEVAYALPDDQIIIPLTVDAGTTIEQAVIHSGIIDYYPQIELSSCKVGIFGKLAKMDKIVREGDRVEVYRPLIADPKEVRRKRAAEGKKMKKGVT